MKVTIEDKEERKLFKPFTITFHIENVEEARLMFHICNCYRIDRILKENYSEFNYSTEIGGEIGGNAHNIIRDEIERQGYEL